MLQNRRLAYVSSAGNFHNTTLGRINKLDGRKALGLPSDTSRSRARRSGVKGSRPESAAAAKPRRDTKNLMAPSKTVQNSGVIDLTVEDEVPTQSDHAAHRKRGSTHKIIRERIDISSSPEPVARTQSHAKHRNPLNRKTKDSANHAASRLSHMPASSSSGLQRTKNAPSSRASDDNHDRHFGDRKHSAILERGGSSAESTSKHSTTPRARNMVAASTSSTLNGPRLPKRPHETDKTSDSAPPAKKPKVDGETALTSSNGSVRVPHNRNVRSKLGVIDLTADDGESQSPEVRIPRRAGDGERLVSGAHSRVTDATKSLNLNFATRTGAERLKSRNAASAEVSTTNASKSIPGRTPTSEVSQRVFSNPRRDCSATENDGVRSLQRSSTSRASEVPESEPATPNTAGKGLSRSTPTQVPGTDKSRSSTPRSKTARLLSHAFESANSTRAESSRSSPSYKSARATPCARSPQPPTASTKSGSGGTYADGQLKMTPATKVASEQSSAPSNFSNADRTATVEKAGAQLGALKQRSFPLSPSATSAEDNGNKYEEASKQATKVTIPQSPRLGVRRTPQKDGGAVLEIPESASKSRPSTTKKPEIVSGTKFSPRHRSVNYQSPAASQGAQQSSIQSSLTERARVSGQQSSQRSIATAQTTPSLASANPTETQRQVTITSSKIKESHTGGQKFVADLSALSASHQIERVVGGYIEELHADNEFWNHAMLKRARLTAENNQSNQTGSTDVFSKMRPITVKETTSKAASSFSVEILSKKSRSHWAASYSLYENSGNEVPGYSQYVSIKDNFLAHNDVTLQHYPYFGDEFDIIANAEGLSTQYFLDVPERERKLERLAKAETLASYAEDMLKDIGCQWSDVLYFLLELQPDVGSDPDAKNALSRRDREHFNEDLARTSRRWTMVKSLLGDVEAEKVGRAAILCDHFQRLAKITLWHVARMSQFTRGLLEQQLEQQSESQESRVAKDDGMACRICMRFDCPYHGEINEIVDSEEDDENFSDSEAQVANTDIINPPNVNYHTRIGFPESIDEDDAEVPKSKHSIKFWQTGTGEKYTFKPDERKPFYPCHHPGQPCNTALCSCFELRLPCEKSCGCGVSCGRKFQGCDCTTRKGSKGRKVCFETDECVCFQLGRECDPDLCGQCGVSDVLDPCNREDDRILEGNCRNANIQRGVRKHTVLGDSGIHGLGLYACETIHEHDFVGEYKGEIVTKNEAERRGAVYEHQKLSYLFSLNQTQEIDSTHFGNKIRFINHALKANCNLYPRIQLVNTVHRIALYGARTIKVGEELFFDYGPQFPSEQLGGKTGKKTTAQQGSSKAAPHVRNSNLVKDFYDITKTKDADGTMRARKSENKLGLRSSREDAIPAASSVRRRSEEEDSDIDDADESDAEILDEDEEEEDDDFQGEQGRGYDINKYNIVDDDADIGPIVGEDDDDEEDFLAEEESSDDTSEYESEEELRAQRNTRGRPRFN